MKILLRGKLYVLCVNYVTKLKSLWNILEQRNCFPTKISVPTIHATFFFRTTVALSYKNK